MEQAVARDRDERGVDKDLHRLRNGIAWTIVLLVLLLVVGLAVPDLRVVLRRAASAHVGWLVAAVGLELFSCLGYVATLRLVLHRGPASQVRWLAWAEMAFGAVVPVGGAGGLAVGAWAMHAWGIAWSRIANRSAVIFLLTTAINASVLAVAGFGRGARNRQRREGVRLRTGAGRVRAWWHRRVHDPAAGDGATRHGEGARRSRLDGARPDGRLGS